MEELGGERTHVDIMLQFLEEAGISREEADQADAAPGTLAAIEMIVGACQRRSALEGLALLAFVEDQHGGANGVAARVYREMVGHYGFSARAAETYHLHAEQDEGHGGRQIDAIRRFATTDEMQARIRGAVQLGTWAFNFEWDGHVQAMTGQREHWGGVGQLELRQPRSSADQIFAAMSFSATVRGLRCRGEPRCRAEPRVLARRLERPVLGQRAPKADVLSIVLGGRAQALQGNKQLIVRHVKRARDHTRGLLEVTASIAVSTPHALHDVAIVGAQSHLAKPV